MLLGGWLRKAYHLRRCGSGTPLGKSEMTDFARVVPSEMRERTTNR